MGELLFIAAFSLYVVGLFHSIAAFVSNREGLFRIAEVSVLTGFALHTIFLIQLGIQTGHLPLTDLRESLTFLAWTVSLCFLVSSLRYRIRALGPFILPLVAVLMLGTVFSKSSPTPEILLSSWIYFHTTFILLAYATFFVTFVSGILYLVQEKELKRKRFRTFYHRLPSLDTLDRLFSRFLLAGFCFMTIGLLAGVAWAERDWISGWQRDPKVIAAAFTWAIYLALLYARLSAGWRGRKAAVLSTAGFLSVLFTFLGTSYLGSSHSF